MNIRAATPSDALDIKTLVHSLSHYYLQDKTAPLPSWLSKTLAITEFERRLSGDDFITFVYRQSDAVVGYISIKDKNHLYHLFVAETHQGKGIARKLWNHATSTVNSNRYSVRSSLYAVPIYQSFGFKSSSAAANKDGIGFQPMEWRR